MLSPCRIFCSHASICKQYIWETPQNRTAEIKDVDRKIVQSCGLTWALCRHAGNRGPLLGGRVKALCRVQKINPIIATNAVYHVASDNKACSLSSYSHSTQHGPLVCRRVVTLQASVASVTIKTPTHVDVICWKMNLVQRLKTTRNSWFISQRTQHKKLCCTTCYIRSMVSLSTQTSQQSLNRTLWDYSVPKHE